VECPLALHTDRTARINAFGEVACSRHTGSEDTGPGGGRGHDFSMAAITEAVGSMTTSTGDLAMTCFAEQRGGITYSADQAETACTEATSGLPIGWFWR
jgi:hypothetical protein